MSCDSVDRKSAKALLEGFLSSTFFSFKARQTKPSPEAPPTEPTPTLTTKEDLDQIKINLIHALRHKNFDEFTVNMDRLRELAKRGGGHLPAFIFYYYVCSLIHGPEKFALFFKRYMPDDPVFIFDKHRDDYVPLVLDLTIKPYQFQTYVNISGLNELYAKKKQAAELDPQDAPSSANKKLAEALEAKITTIAGVPAA